MDTIDFILERELQELDDLFDPGIYLEELEILLEEDSDEEQE